MRAISLDPRASAVTVARDAAAAIVIVAAGEGTRLGFGIPKAFVPVGGVPMVQRALDAVAQAETEFSVVVVVPDDLRDRAGAMVASATGGLGAVVSGGDSRHESVRRGLAAVPAGCRTVLVHDAARALAPADLLDRVAAAVAESGHGIVPGLAIADTIKRTVGAVIEETIDRSTLAAVQTPQGFPFDELVAAYAAVAGEYTDDTAVFAAVGKTVHIVPGDPRAFKITTADDLARAELMLGGNGGASAVRTGIGIDVHAFGADGELKLAGLSWPGVPALAGHSDGDELKLAGLSWPGVPALAGHSDGDAVAHAICDALLSAAGLGDIGEHFGTADPRYSGAAGEVFLIATAELLAKAGFAAVNVAVQIVGNRPRLAARRGEAQAVLSELLGVPVSLAATTTDGLGFTGRDEGIAVIATALVRSSR